ncbi:GntR family transcriptional regulator [Dactylosporangium sp. NPDC050688]|uniref:GntR family transcriptional regulator n=1 Tax=Dactylosporangium sp. NPDC050688 TaxID=3157217 RepID=UPI0033C9FB37
MARVAAGVVAEVCRRIAAGQLRPGEPVPSAKDLAGELGVTAGAAGHALVMLRQDGLVEDSPGGPVVTGRAPGLASGARAGVRRRGSARADERLVALTVRTAIELADAHGLGETSMRRVAGELDMDFTAVRKHVPDRARLELLMADAVFAEHPPPEPVAGADPRARLEALCRAQLSMYRSHRWLAQAVSFKEPQLGPHVAAHLGSAVRALEGEEPQTARRLAVTAANFVRGHAMRLAQQEQEQAQKQAQDEEQAQDEDGALFEFGLQRLLDGFARPVPARGGSRGRQ